MGVMGQIETPYRDRDEAIDALVQELFRQAQGATALIVRRMQVDLRDVAEALAKERRSRRPVVVEMDKLLP